MTYYSKCVSALHLISENVKSKILECGPFSGGHFSIHSINGMSKGHENLELSRRLAKEIGRSRVVINLFEEEAS